MTKQVKIGNVVIGGGNPVAIQSMANIKTSKIDDVVRQIAELEVLGCDIIRVSVKDDDDVKALSEIKKEFRFRLSPIFILIINTRLKRLTPEWIKSGSIPAISAPKKR